MKFKLVGDGEYTVPFLLREGRGEPQVGGEEGHVNDHALGALLAGIVAEGAERVVPAVGLLEVFGDGVGDVFVYIVVAAGLDDGDELDAGGVLGGDECHL